MDRIADDRCDDCGQPAYQHDRVRERLEDGQFVFSTECPPTDE